MIHKIDILDLLPLGEHLSHAFLVGYLLKFDDCNAGT